MFILKKLVHAIGVQVLLIPFMLVVATSASAQSSVIWPPPQRIPDYEDDTFPPLLIADRNRTVHAFSTQRLSGSTGPAARGIVYNRWSLRQGWTAPTNIMLSPFKNEARVEDVFLDASGIVHLIFYGGDSTQANIYYSSAPLAQADDARAWSVPVLASADAADPENGVFYINTQGGYFVLFSGRQTGNGLYEVSSTDHGVTWSKPVLVTNTRNSANAVSNLKISRGDSGLIHVVWNEVNSGGQGRAVSYIQKVANDSQWSAPINLAVADADYGTNTPAIIEYQNTIFTFHNLGGVIWQRSSEDGVNWTPPRQLYPHHVGVNGALSLIVDGNNDLHMFFGQRITGSPDIHGMWHSIFQGYNWSEPGAVISGPRVADQIGDKTFDPYEARAVISQGNILLVTWRSDPGPKPNGVWYSYQVLDAPELPVEPIPTALPIATISPDSTGLPSNPSPTLAPTPLLAQSIPQPPSGSVLTNNPIGVLFLGLIPVVLLIAIVFVFALVANRRRA